MPYDFDGKVRKVTVEHEDPHWNGFFVERPTSYLIKVEAAEGVSTVEALGIAMDSFACIERKSDPKSGPKSDPKSDPMRPKKVFRSGPVTGIVWNDDTKTMTRLDEGDYDMPHTALLNCYWRKRENNRGKSDSHYMSNVLVGTLASAMTPDEMRSVAEQLKFLADANEVM